MHEAGQQAHLQCYGCLPTVWTAEDQLDCQLCMEIGVYA